MENYSKRNFYLIFIYGLVLISVGCASYELKSPIGKFIYFWIYILLDLLLFCVKHFLFFFWDCYIIGFLSNKIENVFVYRNWKRCVYKFSL